MKAKTELFLYHCLWMADAMMHPTWRNLTGSFEQWSYQNGFLRQMHALEHQGWLEIHGGMNGNRRLCRLTRKGFLQALGGTQPEERWNRGWDGKWRMVVFDLPEKQRALRNRLRKQLRAAHFGGLQRSVWICPDPVDALVEQLRKTLCPCRIMTFFEGSTCCGQNTTELVASAWNFQEINDSYLTYQAHLVTLPRRRDGPGLRDRLLAWGDRERLLWATCLNLDPLLPRELWPANYRGEQAWAKRLPILRRAGKLITSPEFIP